MTLADNAYCALNVHRLMHTVRCDIVCFASAKCICLYFQADGELAVCTAKRTALRKLVSFRDVKPCGMICVLFYNLAVFQTM